MDELWLRIIRLRLPGLTELLHVLRQDGSVVDDDRYPGAQRLLVADGRVVAATSPSRLLAAVNVGDGSLAAPVWPRMLVLDVRAVGHRLARSPRRWTGTTRGTIIEFDDLVWDADSVGVRPHVSLGVRPDVSFPRRTNHGIGGSVGVRNRSLSR